MLTQEVLKVRVDLDHGVHSEASIKFDSLVRSIQIPVGKQQCIAKERIDSVSAVIALSHNSSIYRERDPAVAVTDLE